MPRKEEVKAALQPQAPVAQPPLGMTQQTSPVKAKTPPRR